MKEYVVGIDIGGTFTKFGFVDRDGKIFEEGSSPSDKFDKIEDYLANLFKDIKEREKNLEAPCKVIGVGIGAPNGNFYRGTIENAPNLNWKGIIPLAEMVNKYYDVPVRLTNDANAAALGEKVYGGAQGIDNFIMITLGTGLGSGIIVNGDLVYGHDGFAGELGHTNVEVDGRQCGCGNKGCLETYVSAPGIKRTVFELLAHDSRGSNLVKYSFDEMDSELIYNEAKKDDPVALKAFEITGKILGRKLADSVAHTSPKAIFLFGGLAKSGDYILKPTKKYLEEFVMGPFKGKVDVKPSQLMDRNVAVLGSSSLIWKDVK
ncbi:ROK family protein [Natronogracilivirga saccharolytica]|uniref:ROK family protein n=1 Tax=Natronogracilivirga saccharolytica TaxID=2812953 RepID=A0A8J7RJ98_9BACT|nr:ROK family protein [Natronogracilivirga saccharolytica]MBP3192790.1 ROK family protein [Natronogracilivirga saccharolytica]